MTPRKTFQEGTLLMLRLVSPAFPACPMKPYEHISILLTCGGNGTRADACGAATRAGKHLFPGTLLLPEKGRRIFLCSLAETAEVKITDRAAMLSEVSSVAKEGRTPVYVASVEEIRQQGNNSASSCTALSQLASLVAGAELKSEM